MFRQRHRTLIVRAQDAAAGEMLREHHGMLTFSDAGLGVHCRARIDKDPRRLERRIVSYSEDQSSRWSRPMTSSARAAFDVA